jgi:hypothetical protein
MTSQDLFEFASRLEAAMADLVQFVQREDPCAVKWFEAIKTIRREVLKALREAMGAERSG